MYTTPGRRSSSDISICEVKEKGIRFLETEFFKSIIPLPNDKSDSLQMGSRLEFVFFNLKCYGIKLYYTQLK